MHESRPAILKYLSFYYSDIFQHFHKTNGIWQGEEKKKSEGELLFWKAVIGGKNIKTHKKVSHKLHMYLVYTSYNVHVLLQFIHMTLFA